MKWPTEGAKLMDKWYRFARMYVQGDLTRPNPTLFTCFCSLSDFRKHRTCWVNIAGHVHVSQITSRICVCVCVYQLLLENCAQMDTPKVPNSSSKAQKPLMGVDKDRPNYACQCQSNGESNHYLGIIWPVSSSQPAVHWCVPLPKGWSVIPATGTYSYIPKWPNPSTGHLKNILPAFLCRWLFLVTSPIEPIVSPWSLSVVVTHHDQSTTSSQNHLAATSQSRPAKSLEQL